MLFLGGPCRRFMSHLAQMGELQEENAKLKRMYADLALMHHALKDVVERKL